MTVECIVMRGLVAALFLVVCYYPWPSDCLVGNCDSVPREKGNFSFVAQSWAMDYKQENSLTSFVLNCSTNNAAANVTLEYCLYKVTPYVYKPYKDNPNLPSLIQNGQIFTINELNSSATGLYRCKGTFSDQEICLLLGLLYVRAIDLEKPTIWPRYDTFNKTLGENFHLRCEAPGSASEEDSILKWYKKTANGDIQVDSALTEWESFTSGGKFIEYLSIVINSIKRIHAGTYICKKVTGPTAEIRVVVKDPTKPELKLEPPVSEVKVVDGQNKRTTIVCRNAGGSPKPKKEWRDPSGKVVHSCFEYSETCTLDILGTSHEKHHGRYTCVATNSAGTTRIDVLINVLVKVELDKSLAHEAAGYNQQALLICKVKKANPLPTMVWYYQDWSCVSPKNCEPTDQDWKKQFPRVSLTPPSTIAAAESRLIVPQSKSNAFYSCHATNAVSTDVYNVTLHRIAIPPSIFALNPSLESINENDTFVLNCSASEYVYKDIGWTKDGKTLIEVPTRVLLRSTFSEDAVRTLSIQFKHAILTDTGRYTCIGLMRNGTKKSISYSLYVKALESPNIFGFENRTLYQANKNAVLFCNATGNPEPLIIWKFLGIVITEHGIVRSVDDCKTRKQGIYFVESSNRREMVICVMNYKVHQGLYECIAENNIGRKASQMHLEILVRPSFITWEEKVEYLHNSPVRLFCEADGNPAPNVTILRMKNGKQEVLNDVKKYGSGRGGGNRSAYISFDVNEETNSEYVCLAVNIVGRSVSRPTRLVAQSASAYTITKPLSSSVITAIVVSIVLFIILTMALIIWCKRRLDKDYAPYLKPNRYFQLDPNRTLFEQSSELPYDPDWEFPRERLKFVKMIGSGAFGEVWLAEAEGILTLEPRDKTSNAAKRRSKIRRSLRRSFDAKEKKENLTLEEAGEKTLVAVKTLKGDASDTEYKDLASELKILIHIGENKQIVNLLGACTRAGNLCVVLEYCPHGNLLNFLRDRRDIYDPVWLKNEADMSNELTTIDLAMIAYQIAKGLDFLASKKCVHRDVAARNVLVGVDYIVKVADFGLARDIYKDELYMKSTSGLLPVKWMAPESLFDKIYTSQSDVWSYGIVLWEIFTLGGSPYPGLPTEDLFGFLEQGHRMEQPELCPLEFYAIMSDCWKRNPTDRPSFSHLVDRVGQIISNRSAQDNPYLDFDESDATKPPVDSDYLEPIVKRTLARDPHSAKDGAFTSSSMRKKEPGDASDYLNDDSLQMNLLEDYDKDLPEYVNTGPIAGISEFSV